MQTCMHMSKLQRPDACAQATFVCSVDLCTRSCNTQISNLGKPSKDLTGSMHQHVIQVMRAGLLDVPQC